MKECECRSACPFFNDKIVNMPVTSEAYKNRYCMSNYSNCARYMVFKALGKEKVPADLFPVNTERAKQIINDK